MKRIFSNDIIAITESLLSGGIVLVPTDTVYGLAVLPSNKEAVHKIYKMKQRPEKLKLPIMVSKPNDLYDLGLDINSNARSLLLSPYIPGSITLILGFANSPRPEWLDGRDEVAVRIPDNSFMLSILAETGPLFVTSANRHGSQINMGLIPEILEDLNEKPDIIVDVGPLSDTPSTIINCRHERIEIERLGQISLEQIKKYLNYD